MIDKDGSLHCDNCGKEILLNLAITEGRAEFYCPRCHVYHKIIASTAQVSSPLLTNAQRGANINLTT